MEKFNKTDVHQALNQAVDAEINRVPMSNANFKIHPLKKEMAENICQQSGTTLSAFLRQCVDGLIKDYVGPKALQELNKKTV